VYKNVCNNRPWFTDQAREMGRSCKPAEVVLHGSTVSVNTSHNERDNQGEDKNYGKDHYELDGYPASLVYAFYVVIECHI